MQNDQRYQAVDFNANAHGIIKRVRDHFGGDPAAHVLEEAENLFETFRPVHRLKVEALGKVIRTGFLASLHCLETHSSDADFAILLPSAGEAIELVPECAREIAEACEALVRQHLFQSEEPINPSMDMVPNIGKGIALEAKGGRVAQEFRVKERTRKALEALVGVPKQVVEQLKEETEHFISSMQMLSSQGSDGEGIGHEYDRLFETNKMVFCILGPHTLNYGEDKNDEHDHGAHIVFTPELLQHPDVYVTVAAATFYNSGHADKVRPWWLQGKQKEPFRSLVAEKLHPCSPKFHQALAFEFLGRVAEKKNKKLWEVGVSEVLEYWKQENAHFVVECHLPYVTPLTLVEKVIVSAHSFGKLDPALRDRARKLFGHRLHEEPDVNSTAVQWKAAHAPLRKPSFRASFSFTLPHSHEAELPAKLAFRKRSRLFFLASHPEFVVTLSSVSQDGKLRECAVVKVSQHQCEVRCEVKKHNHVSDRFNAGLQKERTNVLYCLSYDPKTCELSFQHAGSMLLVNREKLSIKAMHSLLVVTFKTQGRMVSFTAVRIAKEDDPLEQHEMLEIPMPPARKPLPKQATQPMEVEEAGWMTKFGKAAVGFFLGGGGQCELPLCEDGARCPAAYGTSSDRRTAEQQGHMAASRHLCLFGANCTDHVAGNKQHDASFLHIKKQVCPSSSCDNLQDLQHRLDYHHPGEWDLLLPCRAGRACKDKRTPHLRKYHHESGEYVISQEGLRFDPGSRAGASVQESNWKDLTNVRSASLQGPGSSSDDNRAAVSRIYDFGAVSGEIQDSVDDMGDIYNVKAINGDYEGATLDMYGNPIGMDLVKDGALEGYKLLIGCFYQGEGLPADLENLTLPELHKKGWEVKVESSVSSFTKQLEVGQFHVAWVISNSTKSPDERAFLKAVRKFHEDGRGLMIWGDNEPYFAQANEILPSMFGFRLQGDTPGGKELSPGKPMKAGHFNKDHFVCAGILKLHEGITICYPDTVPQDWQVYGTSSNGKPLLLAKDVEGKTGAGRVVVDNGFTKLMRGQWTTAGTPRYVSNAAAWLAWRERWKGPKRGFQAPAPIYP